MSNTDPSSSSSSSSSSASSSTLSTTTTTTSPAPTRPIIGQDSPSSLPSSSSSSSSSANAANRPLGSGLSTLRPTDAARRLGSGRVPCAKNSLLMGVGTAAGVVGVGTLAGRGLRPSMNWGVGAFVFVSLASWETCRRARKAEQLRMQTIIESYSSKRGGGGNKTSPSAASNVAAPAT